MGQKQSSMQTTFFCPNTGQELADPLGLCPHCQACHDILWQTVLVCPNTGYRIDTAGSGGDGVVAKHRECPSCFQPHQPHTKRVYVCPVTGAQIAHPRETGGKCTRCARSHEDNSTPVGSREAVLANGGRD